MGQFFHSKLKEYNWPLTEIVVHVLIILLYAVIIFPFVYVYGNSIMAFGVIPVIVYAARSGIKGGILAGIAINCVHLIILHLVGLDSFSIIFGNALPGSISILLIGIVIGKMKDQARQLKRNEERLQSQIATIQTIERGNRIIKQQFNTLFESSPMGIVIIKDEGIYFANNKFTTMYGYSSSKELTNQNVTILQPQEIWEQQRELNLKRKMGLETTSSYESIGLKKDKTKFPIKVTATTITLDTGVATLAFVENIEEKKRVEKEIKLRQLQLMKLQRKESIASLTGSIAHNFNNLITILNGYAEIIQISNDLKEIQNNASKMTDLIFSSSEMIKELIEYSNRPEASKDEKVLLPNDFLTENQQLYKRLTTSRIQVVLDLDPHLHFISINPTHFQQILFNLIINSADAIDGTGIIKITTSNLNCRNFDENKPIKDPSQLHKTMIEIEDDGHGIPKEHLNDIFTPLFTTKPNGTGVGLSLVHNLMKLYNGDITVESTPSQGTVFRLFFPPIQVTDEKNCPLATETVETSPIPD